MPLIISNIKDLGFALNRKEPIAQNRFEAMPPMINDEMPLSEINQKIPEKGIDFSKLTIDRLFVNQDIQSSNFESGAQGWKIYGNGDVEFNDGDFRGTLFVGGYEVETNAWFVGDGSDGALDGSADETITGTNNTVIVKNYASIAAAQGGGKTITVTPTGCVVIIKVQGDCDLTDWTLDFMGKGTTGGAGGAAVGTSSSDGLDGADGEDFELGFYVTGGLGGIGEAVGAGGGGDAGGGGASLNNDGQTGDVINGGANGSDGGTTSNTFNSTYLQVLRLMTASSGAGGGGGASGGTSDPGSGAGGDGGNGGGCVILQVGGDLTFSSTTADFSGENGVDGGDASGSVADGGGGGGGGGGGTFVCLYDGTLTGSLTPDVSGGSGGAGGNDGGSAQDGLIGGNGGDGFYLIEQNLVFS